MSIARRDDRHNEDLVKEIAAGFNHALGAGQRTDEGENAGEEPAAPRFVVTGDSRIVQRKGRRAK
jgi:hypothetical protein